MQARPAHRSEQQSAHRPETAGSDDEEVRSVGCVQKAGGGEVVDDHLLDGAGGSGADCVGDDRLQRGDGVGLAVAGVERRAGSIVVGNDVVDAEVEVAGAQSLGTALTTERGQVTRSVVDDLRREQAGLERDDRFALLDRWFGRLCMAGRGAARRGWTSRRSPGRIW